MSRFDPRINHWSESKREWLNISDMNEVHIINAILKEYNEWAKAVRDCDTGDELVKLLSSPPSADIHIQSMTYELVRRFSDA